MMEWLQWTRHGTLPADPILVEGLPGVGHVGQLVAQQVAEALGGELVAEIHSPDLPPQALVEPDGTARLAALRLHAVPAAGEAPSIVVLTGDCQPLTPHGQFEISRRILDELMAAGCRTVCTLGGVGTQQEAPRVLGAATDPGMVERCKEAGAFFDELGPEGGIIGASGVFLGLARVQGMQGFCLMGESDGSLVDAAGARQVLPVLARLLGRPVPDDGLDEIAGRIEDQIQVLEEVRYYATGQDPEHHYIG